MAPAEAGHDGKGLEEGETPPTGTVSEAVQSPGGEAYEGDLEEGGTGAPSVRAQDEDAFCGLACGFIPEESLQKLAFWFVISGLSMVVIGVVVIAAPTLFRVVAEEVLGVLLVFLGLGAIIHGLYECGATGSVGTTLLAFLQLALGVFLLVVVIKGLGGLIQVFLAAWLLACAACKVYLSIQLRHLSAAPILAISAVLSVVFFDMVVRHGRGKPQSDKYLGLVIGAELISSGIASAAIAGSACIRSSVQGVQDEPSDLRQPLVP